MSAAAAEWRVAVGNEQTSAVYEPATTPPAVATFVCAHGAGGNMADRGVTAVATVLRAHAFDVVRFNFLYTEKRSGRPDPMPRLKECVAAVVSRTRAERDPRTLSSSMYMSGGLRFRPFQIPS